MSKRKTTVGVKKEGSEKCVCLLLPFKDETTNLRAIYLASFPDSCANMLGHWTRL